VLAAEILQAVPAAMPWLVLFRLEALRPLADEAILRRMFALPEQIDLEGHSHVILTSVGPLVAPVGSSQLEHVYQGMPKRTVTAAESLYARYRERLAVLPAREPDCLGVGHLSGHEPVALHVNVDGIAADAHAAFAAEPSRRHYELLRAVGVEFVDGRWLDGVYLARFRNHLGCHILAGALAGFSRTDHCNQFFLGGGRIDQSLEQGLLAAAGDRVARGHIRALAALAFLADHKQRRPLALICQPPPPAPPHEYGDLVPLGIVLAALRTGGSTMAATSSRLRGYLLNRRQDGLWSYHSEGLVTATDSALVLQGVDDPKAVQELERFRDDDHGYVPQLWSDRPEAGRMLVTGGNRHWCQVDVPTTCLIRGLRAREGFQADGQLGHLAARFETRGGLYFANPYFSDWAMALALAPSRSDVAQVRGVTATALAQRLTSEILASIETDFSFGRYDRPLSTAFAILALAALGMHGRLLRLAQLRLLDWMEDDGRFPPATPFYSSLDLGPDDLPTAEAADPDITSQIVSVGGRVHALTYYRDDWRLISTAVAALALAIRVADDEWTADIARPGNSHPRYRCTNAQEYIRAFALPPYVEGIGDTTMAGDGR
jgi:hypothetical protein